MEMDINAVEQEKIELQMQIDEMHRQLDQIGKELLPFQKKKEKHNKNMRLSGFQKKEKGKR